MQFIPHVPVQEHVGQFKKPPYSTREGSPFFPVTLKVVPRSQTLLCHGDKEQQHFQVPQSGPPQELLEASEGHCRKETVHWPGQVSFPTPEGACISLSGHHHSHWWLFVVLTIQSGGEHRPDAPHLAILLFLFHLQATFQDECKFRETLLPNNYNAYKSYLYRDFYVALSKHGRVKRGSKVSLSQTVTHFLPRL